MRSSVDLESILDKRWRERANALGISFKEALNRALRAGLHTLDEKPKKKKYVVRARACGLHPEISHQKLGALVDQLEAEGFLNKNGRR